MLRLAIFVLFLAQIPLWGISSQDFDAYQNVFTQEEIQTKIKKYLQRDPTIAAFYRVTPEALYIGDIAHQKIDYVLQLTSSAPIEKTSQTKHPLKDSKIAIDPGHFGGVYARLEDRYVVISETVAFDEGTLTYLTALELKSLLEAEGANVMITRAGIGQGAIKETFFEWLQKQPALWESKEPLSHLFRPHYNRADLIARAEKINTFSPDITIIIHYNAEGSQENDKTTPLTQANYNLAFIPGAFCAGELNDIESRYEFLRLIVTDDLEQSLKLSEQVVAQFTDYLKVPLMNDRSYLGNICIYQRPGIYSRNLTLTRLIHGPLCYGETLIQNNEQEHRRLATNDTEVAGIPCPSRVKEVARAYFEGIRSYFESD